MTPRAALRQPGLMQPEGELDDIGNAVGHAFAALILEGLDGAARRQEPLLEMLGADDAKMLRGDRLAVSLHRRKKLGDAVAVDLIDAEEARQRLVRAADLVEDLALNARCRRAREIRR